VLPVLTIESHAKRLDKSSLRLFVLFLLILIEIVSHLVDHILNTLKHSPIQIAKVLIGTSIRP
jgi:hypothetical protein